jgi:pimeloyl-ACP methyl ester carboxylesterase
MKQSAVLLTLILISIGLSAQSIDTLILHQPISKYDTIAYKRIIRFDKDDSLYYVEDYFESVQIQMKGTYSSLDKNVKEDYWCNYRTNTKQGRYQTWYENGNAQSRYNYLDGKKNGLCEEFYSNGQISDRGYWIPGDIKGNTRGMRHGNFKGWSKNGELLYDFDYDHGLKINPIDTNYHYLLYKPADYELDTLKAYPLIIYLHGGSHRGTDLNKLYGYGIPDQIYRGREFPFIIAAPQCPVLLRWSTDNWFENFFNEIKSKYRIDTNRVYLTGVSLGGAGTWYLAIKYPEKFAAIAPMSGFTSHIDYIYKNSDNLRAIPIWAFHGVIDETVPVEETDRMIEKLKGKNKSLKYTRLPEIGHWIQWLVYPEQELYDWFLKYKKQNNGNN